MIWRRLIRDQRGISSIEFVIVASVFFMLIFGMADFSRAMWEWNAAAKATHWGVRYAVVNDIVSLQFKSFNGLASGSLQSGEDISVADVIAEFGSDTITCTNAGCENDPVKMDPVAFGLIVQRMQNIYDKIGPENVAVVYKHLGGFAGNSLGPDLEPLVTVRLRNLQFNFITPGLVGIFTLDIPGFPASMTSEDHTSF